MTFRYANAEGTVSSCAMSISEIAGGKPTFVGKRVEPGVRRGGGSGPRYAAITVDY